MHGSDEPQERFTHVCGTAVHANVQGDGGIRIALGTQYTVHHYGVGPHAAGVQWTMSGNDLLIWGPTDSGVALSVTPNTPTVVARGWYWPSGGGGVTISVGVVVAFGSPIDELNPYAILNVPIPTIPIYHAVSTPGGGRVVVGAGPPGIEGGISVNGMGASGVYFDAWAMPGYQFNGWTGDLDSFGIWPTPYVSTFTPIRATANFIRMKQLTFSVTGGGDPPECTGYCTADPAGRYYGVGSIATISAHEQPGHCFRRWKASCDAWPTSVTNSDILLGTVPGHSLAADDEAYYTAFKHDTDLKIKMDTDRSLEAVFGGWTCGPDNFVVRSVPEFADEWALVHTIFPNVVRCNASRFGDASLSLKLVNCFGWTADMSTALDIDDVDPTYKGGDGDGALDTCEYDNYPGVSQKSYILYGWLVLIGQDIHLHAEHAAKWDPPCAISKPGDWDFAFRHDPDEIVGPFGVRIETHVAQGQ